MLKIGIPKECMAGEGRVALVPVDCQQLVNAGCELIIESGAGQDSGFEDSAYMAAGGEITDDAAAVYAGAELIVKVKQPLEADLAQLQSHHLLFSYLHLAADPALIMKLCEIGLTAIPFEAVADDQGGYPLLAPMSAIAGRLSIIRGASLLFSNRGGRGVLLGGVDGADPGRVVILGAGVAGSHAASTAVQLDAEVHVFDLKADRLAALKQRWPQLMTHTAEPGAIAAQCERADLVIGAVMVAGRRAPVVLRQASIARMHPGSVIIDIAIDQGGCIEGIRTTSAQELVYRHLDVLHSAVPNMPGAVPRTAAQSLSAAIRPFVQQLASGRLDDLPQLSSAVAVQSGQVIDPVLQLELQ
jgi:alanine dehydrogenase